MHTALGAIAIKFVCEWKKKKWCNRISLPLIFCFCSFSPSTCFTNVNLFVCAGMSLCIRGLRIRDLLWIWIIHTTANIVKTLVRRQFLHCFIRAHNPIFYPCGPAYADNFTSNVKLISVFWQWQSIRIGCCLLQIGAHQWHSTKQNRTKKKKNSFFLSSQNEIILFSNIKPDKFNAT